MKRAGMVPDNFIGSLGRLMFSRVGRTDKGVHAAGQLVALKASMGILTDDLKLDNRDSRPPHPADDDKFHGTKTVLAADDETIERAILKLEKTFPNAFRNREFGFESRQGYLDLIWRAGRELDATKMLQRELNCAKSQFQVHGICRVTNAFDARKYASGRHYEYLLPSWLLCPVYFNNTGFPEMSKGDVKSFVDFHHLNFDTESVDRTTSKTFLPPFTTDERDHAMKLGALRRLRKMNGFTPPVVPVGTDGDVIEARPLWENGDTTFEKEGNWRYNVYDVEQRLKYKLNSEDIVKLRSIFKQYQGTHSFHNFTSGLKPEDPACARHMNEIDVDLVEDDQHGQLIIVRLHGQSFLLNQIRKMVALAIEVFRGSAPPFSIPEAFAKDVKRYVPMAPAEGLLLDIPEYVSYNTHKASPPQSPYLPGANPSAIAVVTLLENDEEVDFGCLNPHMKHILNVTNDIKQSTTRFKNEVVYAEVLRSVRTSVQNTQEEASSWRNFVLDLDWHPYGMENFPPGRVIHQIEEASKVDIGPGHGGEKEEQVKEEQVKEEQVKEEQV
eukprot:GHVH01015641.1.p1 GENE.GHVH01015641.1~~GHVH01015641.1.p1  ORF type:complete len:641 (-),score=92.30 GHVH01015641.1:90-1754(-)